MKAKEIYYQALIASQGRLDELALGESLGFTDEETRKLIHQLLLENKIEYIRHGACNYRKLKRGK